MDKQDHIDELFGLLRALDQTIDALDTTPFCELNKVFDRMSNYAGNAKAEALTLFGEQGEESTPRRTHR